MNKILFTNERIFISLVRPSGSGKSHRIFSWLKIGTFLTSIRQNCFFLSTLSTTSL